MDIGLIEFHYTIEVGGEWQAGRGDLFYGNEWSRTADDLEQQLEKRAEDFEGQNWDRRVSMLLDGGNVVPCAAVKLPNGRIFDAVLGRFDDDSPTRDHSTTSVW
jgi:hypothetical protein